jgi:hypothetical protein
VVGGGLLNPAEVNVLTELTNLRNRMVHGRHRRIGEPVHRLSSRRPVAARSDHAQNVVSRHDGGHPHNPTTERLTQHVDVGYDVLAFAGECRPAPSQARLNLVGEEQHARVGTDTPYWAARYPAGGTKTPEALPPGTYSAKAMRDIDDEARKNDWVPATSTFPVSVGEWWTAWPNSSYVSCPSAAEGRRVQDEAAKGGRSPDVQAGHDGDRRGTRSASS